MSEVTEPRRASLRSVALPTEHGGWGLTFEPVLLGLLVAPSWSGAVLGLAAFVAFLARTPMKWVLVDRWRHRHLQRTALAARVAAIELALLVGLAAVAALTADGAFWVPLAVAAPLVVLGFWFDMRSRSRRLLPELAGTIGIGSVAPAIVLADGGDGALAAALWMVVAARAVASIPFVRLQLRRFKQQSARTRTSDMAQGAAVTLAAAAVVVDDALIAGFGAVVALAALELVAARRTPPRAAILGAAQVVVGVVVVIVTAAGATA